MKEGQDGGVVTRRAPSIVYGRAGPSKLAFRLLFLVPVLKGEFVKELFLVVSCPMHVPLFLSLLKGQSQGFQEDSTRGEGSTGGGGVPRGRGLKYFEK